MPNPQLLEYIKHKTQIGESPELIKAELKAAGWQDADIEAAFVPQQTKFGKKIGKTAIVIGIVGLLVLAGAAFASYKYIFVPPAVVLQKAYLNFYNNQSFDFSGSITADISSDQGLFSLNNLLHPLPNQLNPKIAGASNVQVGIDFNGTEDNSDTNNMKSQIHMNLKASVLNFGMDMRYLNKTLYFKVDDIPSIAGSEYSKYSNVWIKANFPDLAKKYGLNINLENGQPDLTSGQKQQIQNLTAQAHLFNGVTKLGGDTVDGVATNHYSVQIDLAGFKNYIDAVSKITASGGGFTSSYDQALQNVQFDSVEVWVGKKDGQIHRISGEISEKPDPGKLPASGSIHFLMNMKNFGHPATIETPTDTKNLDEIISEFTTQAQAQSRDARRLADINQTEVALELYYNDYGKYPRALTDLKTYLTPVPVAPAPDGNCTAQQNTYTYTQKNGGKDYALAFCLGGKSGNYEAGVHTMSSMGIQ